MSQQSQKQNLKQLLSGYTLTAINENVFVTGISSDSRTVDKGYLFLACAGDVAHGKNYIGDAIAKGAIAIALDEDVADLCQSLFTSADVEWITIKNLKQNLGYIASRFYDEPSRHRAARSSVAGKGPAWPVAA